MAARHYASGHMAFLCPTRSLGSRMRRSVARLAAVFLLSGCASGSESPEPAGPVSPPRPEVSGPEPVGRVAPLPDAGAPSEAPEAARSPEPSDRATRSFAALVSSAAPPGGGSGGDRYALAAETGFLDPALSPLSTFAADVDTASYANVRRFLRDGVLPPAGAVRLEELVNYFDYGYEPPGADAPVALDAELGPAPWAPEHRLVRIGLQTSRIEAGARPPANLVFLIDVSGSMQGPDRLGLLRRAFPLLVAQLSARDTVAVVVYAGAARILLEPVVGDRRAVVLEALSDLRAGGSTAGAAGIGAAYALARERHAAGMNTRVVLATDGDFNVGPEGPAALASVVAEQRAAGIGLSVLGVGRGNLDDQVLELLASEGQGRYAYLDSLAEARRVLVDQLGATLLTVAEDVRVQVEFNPARVSSYRLLGYENRRLAAEAFDDEATDAGEMGAGHGVTALYEVVPRESLSGAFPYRYRRPVSPMPGLEDELAQVRVRYRRPGAAHSALATAELAASAGGRLSAAFRLSAAVAEFALRLAASEHAPAASYERALEAVETLAADSPADPESVAELADLIRRAAALSGPEAF